MLVKMKRTINTGFAQSLADGLATEAREWREHLRSVTPGRHCRQDASASSNGAGTRPDV